VGAAAAGKTAKTSAAPGIVENQAHSNPIEEHAMTTAAARFHIGQLVHHRLFDYRGVVVDVDPIFSGSDEWYEQVARSRPPKDQPWYRVLVHGAKQETYVAERNLEQDDSGEPIRHPLLGEFFGDLEGGRYRLRGLQN
jgi:heat shock protein HspQ